MPIAAGERIGPYEILEPLGAGGMGEVYAAVDTRLRRRVAIKRLLGPATRAAELRRRALNEARAAAKLSHPHIAAVYDVLEADDALLIVMEYVEGQTLAARLRQGRLPLDESIRVVTAIAEALGAAHRSGVLHRDLKPSNVVLTPDGQVKILDFGLARINEPSADDITRELATTTTAVGELAGTPAYMPPERVMGKPVDHRGDLYSLGVLFFELLTGRLPFNAPDFLSLLTRIATQPAPAPHNIDPSIPRDISAVVTRAMATDPEDRFPSAEAMVDALQRRTTVDALGGRRSGSVQRPRWVAPVLGIALLIGIVAGAVTVSRFSRRPAPTASSSTPPTVVVLPLTNNTGDPGNDHLGVGMRDVLTAGLFTLPGVNIVPCAAEECRKAGSDIQTIADRLNAAMVVDGEIRQEPEALKLTLRLTEPPETEPTWTGQYTSSRDLVHTQGRMTADLANALRREIPAASNGSGSAEPTPAAVGTSNVIAFDHYAQARLLLERTDIPGHTERAIKLLQSATKLDTNFALAYAALGQAYWLRYEETGERPLTTSATTAALEALRLDSSQPLVRLSLATIYLGTGDLKKAEAEARTAVERQPQSDEAHRVLASVLIEQGRGDEAMAAAKAALQLRPRFWRNQNQIGYIHYREGRFDNAVDAYRTSIRLQPDNAQAYHMLGASYLAMGKQDEALTALMRGNDIQPDAVSLSNLGTIHYWNRRYEAAAAAYRRAVQLTPKEPLYHRNLGDALQRLGRPGEAREAYTRAVKETQQRLQVSPNDVNRRSMLAVYLAKIGEHTTARTEIARALQTGSESEEVWYRKAVVHALGGDRDAAIDALGQAMRRGASRAVAAQDEDLAVLRQDPRFKTLVAQSASQGG